MKYSPHLYAESRPNKGFTLTEAMLATALASMILLVAWSWFQSSMRGVAHNEETLQALTELQNLATLLRQDLSRFSKTFAPVDLYWRSNPGLNRPPHEALETLWNDRGLSDSLSSTISPSRASFSYQGQVNGKPTYKMKLSEDTSFKNHDFENRDMALGYLPGFATYEIQTEDEESKESMNCREVWLSVGGATVLWRHYMGRDNEDLGQYIKRYTVNEEENELVLTHTFGHNDKGKGILEGFNVSLNFENSIFTDPKFPGVTFYRYVKMYFGVTILMKGERQGFGPEGRQLPFSMAVFPEKINGLPYQKVKVQ